MRLLSQSRQRASSYRRHPSLDALSRSSSPPSTSRTSRLLRLPYFWDEAGYYIPAAWDFFRTGTLIPQTTVTNAHPPLPSILLAAWWHLSGFVVSGTRTLVCMVAPPRCSASSNSREPSPDHRRRRRHRLLTAIYPIWFAQSTLAHADIFAAAFTLWGLAFYFDRDAQSKHRKKPDPRRNPVLPRRPLQRDRHRHARSPRPLGSNPPLPQSREAIRRRIHLNWLAALLFPILPLAAWYAYHYHRTGFVFGNPEFLRYNATANLDAYRIALCLWHRLLHLTTHMNMFVPVVCAIAVFFIPVSSERPAAPSASRTLKAIAVVLLANWIAFSILGGALLTRYLLPMYPLILLLCVATWHRHLRQWWLSPRSAPRPSSPASGSTRPTPSPPKTTSPTAT